MITFRQLFLGVLAIVVIYRVFTDQYQRKWSLASDLGVIYTHSKHIQEFKNPYSVFSENNKEKKTEKAPPYFPLGYIFIAFLDKISGSSDFFEFLKVWYKVSWLNRVYLAILLSYFFYVILKKHEIESPVLSSVVLGFGLISHRLFLKKSFEQLDILSLSLLLTGFLFIRSKLHSIAFVFLGLSISFKQTFIFIIPAYVFYFYRVFGFRKTLQGVLVFSAVVATFYLPMLITDAKATLYYTTLFHIGREGVELFLKFAVPYISYFLPKYLHPGVIVYLITLFAMIIQNRVSYLGFLLPVSAFFLFHKYPLDQYFLAIFLCGLVGVIWHYYCEKSHS